MNINSIIRQWEKKKENEKLLIEKQKKEAKKQLDEMKKQYNEDYLKYIESIGY